MAQISGMHHACIIVPDIKKAKQWYENVIGLKTMAEFDLGTPEVGTGVGVPKAHLKGAMLQWGDAEGATMVELIEYASPAGKKFDPATPSNAQGVAHIAFSTVDAIDALYKELVAKGVNFYSPPQTVEVGGAEVKFCYFQDLNGAKLEFIGT